MQSTDTHDGSHAWYKKDQGACTPAKDACPSGAASFVCPYSFALGAMYCEIIADDTLPNPWQCWVAGTSGIVLSCCPQHHLFYLQRKDLDDEEDGLPFASRPKVVAAKAARSAVSQPMQITTGATTSYNEVLDDDTDMEEDDTVPQIKLAGTALITLSA